ncbi:hypothetical protein [Turicibacter bilis]|uniref:hypothetical protein n=1 Tax=Turicibacter bilis TaxID=2735723 RepID=UPI003F8B04D9
MKPWKEKIQQAHTEFGEFRKKRNNLAPQYYGYEVNLRNYLINGIADNLKEAILRLEEDIHREKMLNVQRNMRAKMNSMENQLSDQANQLSRQANQLSRQANQFANELENQSNEIAYLRSELNSRR